MADWVQVGLTERRRAEVLGTRCPNLRPEIWASGFMQPGSGVPLIQLILDLELEFLEAGLFEFFFG